MDGWIVGADMKTRFLGRSMEYSIPVRILGAVASSVPFLLCWRVSHVFIVSFSLLLSWSLGLNKPSGDT